MPGFLHGGGGGNPPKPPRPHPTHHLACGCVRISTGRYWLSPACGYPHKDHIAKDDHKAFLVEFVCGCLGFCHCGNERKLRGEQD